MSEGGKTIKTVELTVPVSVQDLAGLELGTVVYLNGVVYTAREGVYGKTVDGGADLPEGLRELSNVNFHCSPAATPTADGGYTLGAVTGTASFRFAKWLDGWFAKTGTRIIIGKGGMTSEDYRRYFVPNGAIYLTTVGYGTGALLGRGVKKVETVHWLDELGVAQALWVLRVERFGPFIVESDLQGDSLFERENDKINRRIAHAYEGTRPPALSRYGETDDREEELI